MSDFGLFQQILNDSHAQRGVFARFYDKYVKTDKIGGNGLPIFRCLVYLEIKIKDQHDVVDRPAGQEDFVRFAREYAAYRLKKEKIKSGTPLNQFAFLSAPQIECCEFRGILTVEDLAALKDEQALTLGLKEEKELAVRFLTASDKNKMIADFEKEIANLVSENERLKEENAALKRCGAEMKKEEK